MIILEKIKYRNFLSSGADGVEVNLNKNHLTLISGTNGAGKTTIIQAIVYALYGIPFANINKPQLINSINLKDMLVEIEFSVLGKKYLVKRGMKPAIFEIYQDGIILNQTAEKKDYQEILEKQILKMTYKVFKQVVILSKADYVPFLRLSAADRREVIENILDIKIFSIMNGLLKESIQKTKDSLKDTDHQIELVTQKIDLQSKFIKSFETEREERVNELTAHINGLQSEIDSFETQVSEYREQINKLEESLLEFDQVETKDRQFQQIKSKITSNSDRYKKEIEFYSSNDICPTCKQDITDSHKTKIIGDINDKLHEFQSGLTQINTKLEEINVLLDKKNSINSNIKQINSKIGEINNSISVNLKAISKFNKDISGLMGNNSNIEDEKLKLKSYAKDALRLNDLKTELNVDRSVQEIAKVILQDSGIKSKIIKQYIPVLNKLMNRYLDVLDFYVMFNLDENFNEVILSRHRDNFTYESFSEGQKLRLDISLLFALREIAKLKNSVNCNILFMDETLDASLDESGIDNLFKILDIHQNLNIFVISHRENMADKFNHHMKITMENNFSKINMI